MKIFYENRLLSNKSEISEISIDLNDDYQNKITELDSSTDISIMAENMSENNIVLEMAVKHWSGYSLYYPNITKLDQKLLKIKCPKIILLKPNSTLTEIFTQFGRVIFDENEYSKSVSQLVYDLFDIDESGFE
ncbi:hypothetical protein [Acinetobacter sp. ANC 4639]